MSKLIKKSAIFFDWFNTLARYEPPREELHSQALREFNVEISPSQLLPGILAGDKYFFAEVATLSISKRSPEEQGKLYFRYAQIMLDKVGIKLNPETIQQLIRKWPQRFNKTEFVLFEDVLGTLKILKERKLVLGLITNATKDAISRLRDMGLEPLLDFVVTSEEAKVDKPSPEIFKLALQKAGVETSAAVHVGDQYEIDVVGARSVGIEPVLIDRYDLYPEITDCSRIRKLPELLECI
jgi:putative hydrolase of the HAD superfamily